MACSNCGTGRGERSPNCGERVIHEIGYHPRKGQVKKLRKEHPDLDVRTAEAVLADIRAERQAPAPKPRMRWVPEGERLMYELAVFDAHLGKLSWAEETGQNFNTKIAVDSAEAAVEDLLLQIAHLAITAIWLPIGNDLLQTDGNNDGKTTTSGTYVDTDSRYIKTFRAARRLMAWTIRRCAQVAPVTAIIIPGNHDELTSFHLGEVLDAEFASDPRVEVDNRPLTRKYRRWGATLLGYDHGKDVPAKRLPMLMPIEAKDDWAASRYRIFHCGHWHKSKVVDPVRVNSENGVEVQYLRALSAADAWHAKLGFVGEPAGAEGFLYEWARGPRATYHYFCEAA